MGSDIRRQFNLWWMEQDARFRFGDLVRSAECVARAAWMAGAGWMSDTNAIGQADSWRSKNRDGLMKDVAERNAEIMAFCRGEEIASEPTGQVDG